MDFVLPGLWIQGVIDRFGQVKPKILFAIEEYQYNGKIINSREKIEEIVHLIPEIEQVIWIPFFHDLQSVLHNQQKNEFNQSNTIVF